MNPVFWLLVILGIIILWFLTSTVVFRPLGKFLLKRWNKTMEVLNKEDEIEEKGE